jgi:prepilin-type processing-associated H-X9-DG protein
MCRISARSLHPRGLNAAMCDGSVGFVAHAIDPAVWRALSTAQGAGSGIPAEINPSVN